jgi:hypothetical protein
LDAAAGGEGAVSDQDAVNDHAELSRRGGQWSVASTHPVIAGLDPAIHRFGKRFLRSWMDARVKPAHDEFWMPPRAGKAQ